MDLAYPPDWAHNENPYTQHPLRHLPSNISLPVKDDLDIGTTDLVILLCKGEEREHLSWEDHVGWL